MVLFILIACVWSLISWVNFNVKKKLRVVKKVETSKPEVTPIVTNNKVGAVVIKKTNSVSTDKVKPMSKRQELEMGLVELRNKKNKTVKDRNTIGVLEAVLKNYNQNLN